MKSENKIRGYLLIAILCIVTGVQAQEIKDDTVYVKTNTDVTIHFPASVDSFGTIPLYSGYRLQKRSNIITVGINENNAPPAVMAVAEGGREHHFVLMQSKNPLTEKVNYDYSTIDKLKDHIWDLKLLKTKKSLPLLKGNFIKTKNDLLYDSLIASADIALNQQSLAAAMSAYSQALHLKPTEYYPNAQIRFITEEMAYQDRQKVNQSIVQKDSTEKEYQKLIVIADNAVKEKRFQVAKAAYIKALAIHPENGYALQRLKIASHQLELETSIKDSSSFMPATEELRSIMHSKFNWQKDPVPYTLQELKKKYKRINFTVAPADQEFNTTSVLTKDHSRIVNELEMTNPKVAFSSTDQNIHLINTDIIFYDSLVYLKFIVQNDSQKDFLTGVMSLTWQRPNKQAIKLYPINIIPKEFPIVKPGNQVVIIYVCKPYVVSNNDHLLFDMSDRMDNIHLRVTIPGSGWNNSDYNKYFIKTVDYREERRLNEPD